jgi:hypothetical protein
MSKVIVYHMPISGFCMLRIDAEKSKAWTKENWLQYTKVLEIDLAQTGDDAAEEIFDLTNNPSRDEERARAGYVNIRSFSSGDVVEVDGVRWLCLSIGWVQL